MDHRLSGNRRLCSTIVEGTAVFLTAETGMCPTPRLHQPRHNKCCMPRTCLSRCATMKRRGSHAAAPGWKTPGTIAGRWSSTTASRTAGRAQGAVPDAGEGCQLDNGPPAISCRATPSSERWVAAWPSGAKAVCQIPPMPRRDRFLNIPSNAVVELGSKIEIWVWALAL